LQTYALDETIAADVKRIWSDPNTKGIIQQAKELVIGDYMNEYLASFSSELRRRFLSI